MNQHRITINSNRSARWYKCVYRHLIKRVKDYIIVFINNKGNNIESENIKDLFEGIKENNFITTLNLDNENEYLNGLIEKNNKMKKPFF